MKPAEAPPAQTTRAPRNPGRTLLLDRAADLRPLKRKRRAEEKPLHDARVALRRFRETLVCLAPLLPRRETRSLDTRVRRALSVLGAVRDADVALALCTDLVTRAASDAERDFLFRLIPSIEAERARAQDRLDGARLRIRKIRAEARALARHLRGASIADGAFLARAREAGLRTLERQARATGGPEDDAGFHAVRLRAKHLRYLIESGSAGQDGGKLAELCVRLQGVLGEFHDLHLFAHRVETALADAQLAPRSAVARAIRQRLADRIESLHTEARVILSDPLLNPLPTRE